MLKSLIASAALFAAAPAFAKTCNLDIDGNDQMKFSKTELEVAKDCTEIKLSLRHAGKLDKKIMGHNWVLTKTSDVDGVVADGLKAGPDKNYIKEKDARVIAHTKVLGGGETDSVTFKKSALKDKTDYTFVCTFPGHAALMKGKLIVK